MTNYGQSAGWPGDLLPHLHVAEDTPGAISQPATGPLVTQTSVYVEHPVDVLTTERAMFPTGVPPVSANQYTDVWQEAPVGADGPVAGGPDWGTQVAQIYAAGAYGNVPSTAVLAPEFISGW